jgi:hypothetical protein
MPPVARMPHFTVNFDIVQYRCKGTNGLETIDQENWCNVKRERLRADELIEKL